MKIRIERVDFVKRRISAYGSVFGSFALLAVSMILPPCLEASHSVCLFKFFFGIPCAGCGLTRAFLFLGHGDIRQAVLLNPNSLIVFLFVILFFAHRLVFLVTGKKLNISLSKGETTVLCAGFVLLTATAWIYNIFFNVNV